MILCRHDSVYRKLEERKGRNLWRLWLEDAGYARLSRNNFIKKTAFEVARRPGQGLIIKQTLLGSLHITKKRGGSLFSYEARDLLDVFGAQEVRLRLHVGQITATPLLRLHSVSNLATENWTIKDTQLSTPSGVYEIRTISPLRLPQTAATIEADIEERNLVYVTELIGNQRPGRVVLRGEDLMLTVAKQFLTACGYGETGTPGEFKR